MLLVALGVGGIVKAPVVTVHLAGKHRACLIRVATNGDDGFDLAVKELVHVLAVVAGNVDADLGQRLDGERMDVSGGFRASALDIEKIPCGVAENPLGHVAAARVAGAEDENGGRVIRIHRDANISLGSGRSSAG